MCAQKSFKLTDQEFEVGSACRVYDIYFIFAKPELDNNASELRVDSIVSFLKENKRLQVEVGSHSDERCSDAMKYRSINLSERRSRAIVEYLISDGIDVGRVEAKGYGDEMPIISNAQTEEAHQINRRVELKIISLNYKRKSTH